jgi:hypothetical protein
MKAAYIPYVKEQLESSTTFYKNISVSTATTTAPTSTFTIPITTTTSTLGGSASLLTSGEPGFGTTYYWRGEPVTKEEYERRMAVQAYNRAIYLDGATDR